MQSRIGFEKSSKSLLINPNILKKIILKWSMNTLVPSTRSTKTMIPPLIRPKIAAKSSTTARTTNCKC